MRKCIFLCGLICAPAIRLFATEPATPAQLEILEKAAGKERVKDYLAPDESVTPDGLRLIAEYQKGNQTAFRADDPARGVSKKNLDAAFALPGTALGGLFDGGAAASSPKPVFDADVQNGRLNHATLSKPNGSISGEVGQLYTSGLYPQAAPSWYGNVTWNAQRTTGLFDYHSSQSVGYADVNARYFSEPPLPQAASAVDLAQSLGASAAIVGKLRSAISYGDPAEKQAMIVASALEQVGRAYHLFGPIDASWTVGNLTRVLYALPTTSFDETVGLRARLPAGASVGVFAGRAQSVSPIGENLLRQEIRGAGGASIAMARDEATHVGAGFWSSGLAATVSRSRSERLSSQNASASVTPAAGDGSLHFVADYSRDRGTNFAYDDKKLRGQLEKNLSPRAAVFLGYQKEQISYGNAAVGAGGWQVGFRMMLGKGASVAVEDVFGKRYSDSPGTPLADGALLAQINGDIATAMAAVKQAEAVGQELRALQVQLQAAEQSVQNSQVSGAQIQNDLAALARTITSNLPLTSELLAAAQKANLTSAQKSALGGILLLAANQGTSAEQALRAQITAALGSPATATAINSLLGLQSRGVAAVDGALGAANNALNPLVAAAASLAKNQADIARVAGLLTNSQMWDALVVQAARTEMVNSLNGISEPVSLLGHSFTVHIDAPVILAAADVLRGDPVAPVSASDVAAGILQHAGGSLGSNGTLTDQAFIQDVYAKADAEVEQQITRALQPLLKSDLSPSQAAAQVLAALPPVAAQALTARYGPDLSQLIPSDLTDAQLKQVLNSLPGKAVAALNQALPAVNLQVNLNQSLLAVGEVVSHEINNTIANAMLAAGEFDRMTVDHGRRVDQLNMGMAMSSFDALSARDRLRAADKADELGARISRADKE